MTDVSTRPSVTVNTDSLIARAAPTEPPLLVGLSEMLASRSDIIGARAARLSQATRSCLPVPAGSVLTTRALGCRDQTDHTCASASADAITDIFDRLGRNGQIPLMVSVSAISPSGSSADRITTSHAVTSRSELLHTVRRLSATATALGQQIAVVIQRDIDIVESGTLTASTSPTRIADSLRTRHGAGGPARLIELARHVANVFDGEHTVAWAIDRCDQLWVLDIGPNRIDS